MSNRLLPIPVCGSGTAEVESLPSYIHRIAYKHGVNVGELLRFVVRQVERDESYTGLRAALPPRVKVHEVLRANRLARGLTQMLEYATGQSQSGTLVSIFNGPLNRSSGELHKGFRWCPECFAEMAMEGGEQYFKLMWQFRAVMACPVHRSPFLKKCDHCGCDQTGYIKWRPLGQCQDCGKPLSLRRKKLNPEDLEGSWQDIGMDVLGLIADLARYGCDSIPADGVYRSLNELFEYYLRQRREKEFYQLLDRDQLLSVVYCRKALSLNAARKVALELGISLYDLLSGRALQTTQTLDFGRLCRVPASFMATSKRLTRNHGLILRKLRGILATEVGPMSLKAVARKLDVSVGYLSYRFAGEVRHIVERNSQHLAERQLQKRLLAHEKALRYFADREVGAPKSQKQAYRSIREETGLPKYMLKDAIRQAYRALE